MFADQQLGILVDPSSVRLIPRPEDRYMWIRRRERDHLFAKHLSKHSIRSYMELCREIGVSIDVTLKDPATAEGGLDGVEVCIYFLINWIEADISLRTRVFLSPLFFSNQRLINSKPRMADWSKKSLNPQTSSGPKALQVPKRKAKSMSWRYNYLPREGRKASSQKRIAVFRAV